MSSIFADYVKFVEARIAPPNLHGLDTLWELDNDVLKAKQLISNDLDLVHIALGLAGEALELSIATDEVNVQEELGDILWYSVGLNIILGRIYEWNPTLIEQRLERVTEVVKELGDKNKPSYNRLFRECDRASDLCKKKVFYKQDTLKTGESIESALVHSSYDLLAWLHQLCPLPKLIETNTAKLTKRYTNKFTPEEAAARKDKDE